MNFKLLVFDWDGTLMDSEARIVDCMRSALYDNGCAPLASENIREIIGLGLKEAIQTLLPEADADLLDRVARRYREHFLTLSQTPSSLFPGAEAVLRKLDEEGYLLAIATGKGRSGLDRALDGTGLHSLFRATRCADESFSKPHPEMLLQIMAELGASAQETLMIGDTEYDMQMAASAGAFGLGVSYGVHGTDRLLGPGVLGCVDALEQIPHWLRELRTGTHNISIEYLVDRRNIS